ncbi:MAG: hypothetical protein ACOCXH_02130 [Cyclobacteriaceae bacterium]
MEEILFFLCKIALSHYVQVPYHHSCSFGRHAESAYAIVSLFIQYFVGDTIKSLPAFQTIITK